MEEKVSFNFGKSWSLRPRRGKVFCLGQNCQLIHLRGIFNTPVVKMMVIVVKIMVTVVKIMVTRDIDSQKA